MLYADVGDRFLVQDKSTQSQVVNTTLMADALHPNTQGLEIIAQSLAPLVESLMQVGNYPSEGPKWTRKQFREVPDTARRPKTGLGRRGKRRSGAGKKRRKGGGKKGSGKSGRKVGRNGTGKMAL